jgi:hypothetical protein
MKRQFPALAVSMLILALAAHAQASPIVVNGGFEADDWTNGGIGFVSHPTVTGWTVTGPADPYPFGINNISVFGPTPFGHQFLVMGGFGTGGGEAKQTISGFTLGLTYELTFSISSESIGSGANVMVSDIGSPTPALGFTAPAATHLQGWDVWKTFTYDFVAGGATSTIDFLDTGNIVSGDIGLDNVSIAAAAVPEPSSLMLLALGAAGMFGYGWRMAKQK